MEKRRALRGVRRSFCGFTAGWGQVSAAEAAGYSVIVAPLQVKGYCRYGGRLLRLLAAGYKL